MSQESLNPETMFESADVFLRAADLCLDSLVMNESEKLSEIIPIITNYSLACEIFLKSILVTQKKPTKGHNLFDLYDELDKQTKDALEENKTYTHLDIQKYPKYRPIAQNHQGARDNFSFQKTMDTYQNSFIEYRYLYEKLESNEFTNHPIYGILVASHTLRAATIERIARK